MGLRNPFEILLIVLLIVLFFGTKKIPELAKSIGLGLKEFKKAMSEGEKPADSSPPKPAAPENPDKKDDAKA